MSATRKLRTRANVLAAATAAVAGIAGFGRNVDATTYTATSGGTWNWSAPGSWSPSGPPNAVAAVAFGNFGTGINPTTTLDQNATLGTLADISNNSGWTIGVSGSNAFTLNNTGGPTNIFGTTNASIYQSSASVTFTVNPNITIANTDLDIGNTSANNGIVTIGGNITASTAQTLWLRANGTSPTKTSNININGTIGASGSNLAIQNVGTNPISTVSLSAIGASVTGITQNAIGSLTLGGNDTNFGGTTTLTAGILTLGSATALGGNGSSTGVGGAFTINGGTLDAVAAGVNVTTVNAQNWNGDFAFVGTGNLNTGSGTVTMSGSRTVTIAANTLSVGPIGGVAAGLTKAGAGSLAITGSSSYTGATSITAGTLAVNGANGAINQTSGITISGPTAHLSLDDSAANNSGAGRINGVAATLSANAELAVNTNTSADTTESMGTLGIDTGNSTITIASAGSRITTLAASGFSRSNNATALVRGSTLGGQATNVGKLAIASLTGLTQVGTSTSSVGNNSSGTSKNLTIVPYLMGDTAVAGVGNNFVTYDTTSGLRTLGTNEYSAIASSPATGDNVKQSASVTLNATPAGSPTWNSLIGTGNAANMTLTGTAGNTLTLSSGALAGVTTGANPWAIGGFDAIAFGNGTVNEAVITNSNANSGAAITINSPITVTGSGGLTKAGGGIVILGGTSVYTGQTTINLGTLQIGTGTGGSLGANTANIVVNNSATLAFGRTNAGLTLSNNISGTGAVVQNGVGGTTVLSGSNSYTGLTTIANGTLQLDGVNTGNGAVTLNGFSTSTLVLGPVANGGLPSGTLTIGGTIQSEDANPRTISNPITFVTTGASTFGAASGGTGNLTFSNIGTCVVASSGITVNPSTTLTLSNGTLLTNNFVKNGNGTLVLNNITAGNLPSFTVNAGYVQLAGTSTITAINPLAINGGTFDLNGTSQQVRMFTGTFAGGTVLNNGNGTVVFTLGNSNTNSGTYGGSIADHTTGNGVVSVVIQNSASGIQGLTGSSSFSGGTTLNAGTLTFGLNSLGTGPITFNGGNGLQWNGSNTQDISSQVAFIGSGQNATFDTNGNSVTFANGLSGRGGVIKSGTGVGSSRVDLQACKLEYSIVSPK